MKWPPGAQLFEMKRDTNDHWKKGDLVEMLDVGRVESKFQYLRDYVVRHHCGDGWSHIGYAWDLKFLKPLTETARAMLAIAKERDR